MPSSFRHARDSKRRALVGQLAAPRVAPSRRGATPRWRIWPKSRDHPLLLRAALVGVDGDLDAEARSREGPRMFEAPREMQRPVTAPCSGIRPRGGSPSPSCARRQATPRWTLRRLPRRGGSDERAQQLGGRGCGSAVDKYQARFEGADALPADRDVALDVPERRAESAPASAAALRTRDPSWGRVIDARTAVIKGRRKCDKGRSTCDIAPPRRDEHSSRCDSRPVDVTEVMLSVIKTPGVWHSASGVWQTVSWL